MSQRGGKPESRRQFEKALSNSRWTPGTNHTNGKDVITLIRTHQEHNDSESEETGLIKLASIAKTVQEKHKYLAKLDDEIISKCLINKITVEVAKVTEVSTRSNQILTPIEAFKIKPTVSNTQVYNYKSTTPFGADEYPSRITRGKSP